MPKSGVPALTINRGIACMSSGDTLLIGNGTYDEILTDYPAFGLPLQYRADHADIPSGSGGRLYDPESTEQSSGDPDDVVSPRGAKLLCPD